MQEMFTQATESGKICSPQIKLKFFFFNKMTTQTNSADYESLTEEFRNVHIDKTMRIINAYLSIQTPNGALNHGREALRSSIFPILGIIGIISDDPDTFGSLEKRKPVFHRMALDIVKSAREKYCVAV